MSVFVYIEHTNGKIKKNVLEAASYAVAYAAKIDSLVIGIAIGSVSNNEIEKLGSVGVTRVLKIAGYEYLNHQKVAAIIAHLGTEQKAHSFVFAGSAEGKGAGPRLAVKIDAGIISEVVDTPSSITPITVKKKAFSGKGFANVELINEKNVIIISTNSFGVHEKSSTLVIEDVTSSADDTSLNHQLFDRDTEGISLPDAELVVSAGRGLKGAENWGIIEDLAETLGAATACSKPVSDIGWRGHHEHVGQTGIAISLNLYIAIGISGAIQHLAGVSSSKTIVVINTDSEAPFFKAADYGIIGDAFEVVPKLTAALKASKD
jgi:electron transfer flavoprotein alpha subunit